MRDCEGEKGGDEEAEEGMCKAESSADSLGTEYVEEEIGEEMEEEVEIVEEEEGEELEEEEEEEEGEEGEEGEARLDESVGALSRAVITLSPHSSAAIFFSESTNNSLALSPSLSFPPLSSLQ